MSINIPILMVMFLTMIVWFLNGRKRLSWIKQKHVSVKQFATRADSAELPLELRKVSDNFQNLFELPVIFYLLCFYLAWGNEVGLLDVILAYVFAISRYVHSFIQCGYNNIVHRFYAHLVGAVALWIMLLTTIWGVFFY